MMLDNEALFSDTQAVTATANSTDVYDNGVGEGNIGAGQPLSFFTQVDEAFATLTTLTIQVIAADDEALSVNPVIVESSGPVAVADLIAGYRFAGKLNLSEKKRYIGFKYTVGGSDATAGQVTSAILLDQYEGDLYQANYTVQTN